MPWRVQTEQRSRTEGAAGLVYVLGDDNDATAACVCPGLGFNCFHWRTVCDGLPHELLYADPQFLHQNQPTRSGIPILFPFPNRIRGGTYTWEGRTFQLPLNDPAGKNAIHGFACRRPWRVVAEGADGQSAWLSGEFHASADAPETLEWWPGDFRLRVTYRLAARSLRVEALVDNPGSKTLPFGLGYHPYFPIPSLAAGRPEDHRVQAPAGAYWELRENLPTGARWPVDRVHNLNVPRPFGHLACDDLLTGLADRPEPGTDGLCPRGSVQRPPAGPDLQLLASPAFRELVVFTPPHRQAVCLEPYTCATDAINLHQQGVDAGLRVLEPGAQWSGVLELRVRVAGEEVGTVLASRNA
jgi:aldose 1-epimerase